MLAEPVQLNTNLGRYTNFMNLLDLCGLAIPAGFRSDKYSLRGDFGRAGLERKSAFQPRARV